jgi:hypothetical protein
MFLDSDPHVTVTPPTGSGSPTMTFDSLRYARRLVASGLSTDNAEAHAEALAAEFGAYMDNLVTKDYLDARFGEQEARFDAQLNLRAAELEKSFNEHLSGIRVTQGKHSIVLAATFMAVVIPLVRELLG